MAKKRVTVCTALPNPLDSFIPRAVVDWVELQLSTAAPTQHRHLLAQLPPAWRSYATPVGENHASCSEWKLTIQDPPAAKVIAHALSAAGIDTNGVKVVGIEVAVDWYLSNSEGTAEFAQAAHHLLRHLAKPPVGTQRITAPKNCSGAARPCESLRALTEGWSVNIGDKEVGNHCVRAYVKSSDSGSGGAYLPLPPSQHRARIEVTLRGNMLPTSTLLGLDSVKYQGLARHFYLRATKPPKSVLAAILIQRQPQLGQPDDESKRKAHKRQTSVTTLADTKTNARIYDALRRLTAKCQRAEIPVPQAPETNTSSEGARPEDTTAPKYTNTKTPISTNTDTEKPDDSVSPELAQRDDTGPSTPTPRLSLPRTPSCSFLAKRHPIYKNTGSRWGARHARGRPAQQERRAANSGFTRRENATESQRKCTRKPLWAGQPVRPLTGEPSTRTKRRVMTSNGVGGGNHCTWTSKARVRPGSARTQRVGARERDSSAVILYVLEALGYPVRQPFARRHTRLRGGSTALVNELARHIRSWSRLPTGVTKKGSGLYSWVNAAKEVLTRISRQAKAPGHSDQGERP